MTTQVARTIDRRENLSREDFKKKYLRGNLPVVVSDGMRDWPGADRWTPQGFDHRFGSLEVTVSGDFFHPLADMTFHQFIEIVQHYESVTSSELDLDGHIPYLRMAYPDRQTEDFTSLFFHQLSDDWRRPYFLPKSFYFTPFDLAESSPNKTRYPEWGILTSPRYACTALHFDRTNDNAVLCLTHGTKVAYLFPVSPELLKITRQDFLDREAGRKKTRTEAAAQLVDGIEPDYGPLTPWKAELRAGDVLFIPKRWAHEVFTTSGCISMTYNFIHWSDLDWKYLTHRLFDRGYH